MMSNDKTLARVKDTVVRLFLAIALPFLGLAIHTVSLDPIPKTSLM